MAPSGLAPRLLCAAVRNILCVFTYINSFGNITIKRVRSYILLNYGRLASNSGQGRGEDQENSEDVWVGGRVTITLATGLYKSLPVIPQAREITLFKLSDTLAYSSHFTALKICALALAKGVA